MSANQSNLRRRGNTDIKWTVVVVVLESLGSKRLRSTSRNYFFFQTSIVFFPPFFKYYVVFQDRPEDYIGEDDIIDMSDVIVL